jgi:plasmid stabilization system protein ParE
MAEVIWAEPALNDLDAIADYIALDNPEAARRGSAIRICKKQLFPDRNQNPR